MSYAEQSVWEKLSPVREQYQNIKTLHVKSRMFNEYSIAVPSNRFALIDYEQWADKKGRYKIVCSFTDFNGLTPVDLEFSYDGNSFYSLDKKNKIVSYGTEDPNGFPIPENPLFTPVLFLKQNSDECKSCILKLRDVIDSVKWRNILAKSEYMNDSNDSQKTINIPTNQTVNGIRAELHIHTDSNDFIERIDTVEATGKTIGLMKILEYQELILNGIKTHWPKIVQISGSNPLQKVTVTLTAEISLLEINNFIPDSVFSVDMSSAKSVWDNDTRTFLKQEK